MKRAHRRRFVYALLGVGVLALGVLFALPRLLGPRVRVVYPTRAPLLETVVTTGRVMAPA